MQFRFRALSELREPSGLDKPIGFANSRAWITITVTGLIVAAFVAWAILADIPQETNADGFVVRPDSLAAVAAPASGQVGGMTVHVGDPVQKSAPLATLTTADGTAVAVTAPENGVVLSIAVPNGGFVEQGQTIASIERQDTPLAVALLVPARNALLLRSGSTARIEVTGVPATLYGQLRGTVQSISAYPVALADLSRLIADESTAQDAITGEAKYLVMVSLEPSTSTRSGFRWTSTAGPPFPVNSQAGVSGAILQGQSSPIDLLFGS